MTGGVFDGVGAVLTFFAVCLLAIGVFIGWLLFA